MRTRPSSPAKLRRAAAAVALLCAVTLAAAACTSSIPAVPENLSPEVDAQIVQGSETRFVWKAQEDVDSYDFHLFNRLDGDTVLNSRDEIPADEVCRDDECSISLEVMLPADDAHAWRVRAVNAEGKSGWSRSLMTVVAEG